MIPSVRAAGIAAAAFGTLALATTSTPLYGQITQAVAPAASAAQVTGQIAQPLWATMRGRPLGEQVGGYSRTYTDNQEQDCLASAVYFEARGESLEGQLAVAEVVLNRAASGRYPTTICGVVEQPWQFSFVNATGRIPEANRGSEAWRRAVAIARIAQDGVRQQLSRDVLWYHADYVAPSWGRRLNRTTKIGLHIFYR
jgi:spore germination cell wall hydrolase CwlJ-like protein